MSGVDLCNAFVVPGLLSGGCRFDILHLLLVESLDPSTPSFDLVHAGLMAPLLLLEQTLHSPDDRGYRDPRALMWPSRLVGRVTMIRPSEDDVPRPEDRVRACLRD